MLMGIEAGEYAASFTLGLLGLDPKKHATWGQYYLHLGVINDFTELHNDLLFYQPKEGRMKYRVGKCDIARDRHKRPSGDAANL